MPSKILCIENLFVETTGDTLYNYIRISVRFKQSFDCFRSYISRVLVFDKAVLVKELNSIREKHYFFGLSSLWTSHIELVLNSRTKINMPSALHLR